MESKKDFSDLRPHKWKIRDKRRWGGGLNTKTINHIHR